ncbi:hypothetical protein [Kineosporia babensis]|uniref:Uncharacterized protein n=1 Tax=Kineosporia babensis TaxID=499548 RepID=A0A9X1NGC6_9ACTN|nr:hypothetical protein [Kineosporia babensis]MCD5313306.1 hypothetical protein [Kineosporia babensis]
MSTALGAAFGAALVLQPRRILALTGTDPDLPGVTTAARILGARHLAQAAVVASAPSRFRAARWAAWVDGLHAASMLALAATAPDYRRAALTSAGVAGALSAAASM